MIQQHTKGCLPDFHRFIGTALMDDENPAVLVDIDLICASLINKVYII